MRIIPVEIIENGESKIVNETVYSVYDFPYYLFKDSMELVSKKKSEIEYYNIACAFDIETTSLQYKYPKKREHEKEKFYAKAFMYQWQFCIDECVVFGRTWEEFMCFIDRLKEEFSLNENKKLVVYVHNLAYEFQFMKDFINITYLFARQRRKPIRVDSDGIEFRCSYMLSNMSLAKFCENSQGVTHYKMLDTYDYKKVRTPSTPLTESEESYCYNDVRGLCECINFKLQEDNIATIPLTNTGYVRRDFREAMKTKENRRKFLLQALNEEQYKMLRKAFRGGNTHANRYYADRVLTDVESWDIGSSYPTQMMNKPFPNGRFAWVELDTQEKLDYYCKNFAVVLEITILNPRTKADVVIPYIDIAHCEFSENIVNDNGRVLSAKKLTITITNIDLDIIRETYEMDGFIIHKAMYSTWGKLPKEFREKVLEFYDGKTQLKDVEGKEYEYAKSKNMLNSAYGMSVTDIASPEVIYSQELDDWKDGDTNIPDSLAKYYESWNSFLSYQWGVFVTSWARRQLQDMLNIVGEDVVYIDTDSIKYVGNHAHEFEEINKKLMAMADNNDIRMYSHNKDGIKFYLGVWDSEGKMNKFKTLGAKKYCYTKYNKKKGIEEFHVTVAGMNKKLGAKAVGSCENFNINQEYENVGRTTSWFHDCGIEKVTINGETFTSGSNIGVWETTYTLGVTQEYWVLIDGNAQIMGNKIRG